jgi:hypothetical protein
LTSFALYDLVNVHSRIVDSRRYLPRDNYRISDDPTVRLGEQHGIAPTLYLRRSPLDFAIEFCLRASLDQPATHS